MKTVGVFGTVVAGPVMARCKRSFIGRAGWLAVPLWLAAGVGIAATQELPAAGHYQCTGGDGTALDFAVGPGNIYTTKTGWRGTMVIHPLSGHVLFRGAAPHSSYEGRYSPGPPPQIELLPETGGNGTSSGQNGIVCRMR